LIPKESIFLLTLGERLVRKKNLIFEGKIAMGLYDDILLDLRKSIKGQDKGRLSVLRGLKSAMKNKQVELRKELTDDQIRGVISSEIKKRKEAIDQFGQGSRHDLVEKEEAELGILSSYLPPQLSAEEIREVVTQAIEEISASSPKDLGRVMKSVMPKLTGRTDGREVNRIARELLS